MIQFYINNRPVPRAIARHHLIESCPHIPIEHFTKILNRLKTGKTWAAKFCAAYGVSAANI